MKVYHITTDCSNPKIMQFIPRVPETASEKEDKETPRICLATSVANCIKAHSMRSEILFNGRCIRVYSTVVAKYNYKDFIPPIYLYKNALVFDAIENQECWCTKPITMDSAVYRVDDFQYEHAINWSCVSIEKLQDLAVKYGVKDLPFVDNSKDLYDYISSVLNEEKRYEDYDGLYEDIVFDWTCQSCTISNLKVTRLCNNQLQYVHRQLCQEPLYRYDESHSTQTKEE